MRHNNPTSGASDPMWGLLIALGLIIAVPWFLWQIGHTQISTVMVFLSSFIFKAMTWLHGFIEGNVLATIVYVIIPENAFSMAKQWLDVMPHINYSAMTFSDLNGALAVSGYVLRPFVILFSLWLVKKAFRETKPSRMTRSISLNYLAKMNTEFFPQIKPAVMENIMKCNPDQGPFAREVSPIRFAILNDAASVIDRPLIDASAPSTVRKITFDMSKEHDDNYLIVPDDIKEMIPLIHNKIHVDYDVIERLFIKQLGKHWEGSSNLPEPIKGLYAAFIAQINADKKSASKILFNMNKSYRRLKGKDAKKAELNGDPLCFISAKGADAIIAKHEDTPFVKRIIDKHSYVTKVMSGLLQEAREKGKLISSDFLWLKVYDRTLWYTLNQMGGQVGWTEAAGPFSHFKAEFKIDGPIAEPYVKPAVNAFKEYLHDTEGWIEGSADEDKKDSEGEL